MQLFRQEVMDAQRVQHLGSIRLGRPLGFSVVTLIAALLAVSLAGFAVWGQFTRKARLPGLLVPALGSLQGVAPQAGTLLESRVHEGEAVGAGQVLMVLGVDRGGAQGDTAALVARSLEQRRLTLEAERRLREQGARQREQALADRLQGAQAVSRQARSELELARRRVDLAGRTVERHLQLARDGFVADTVVQQKQEELIDLQARAQAAARTLLAAQREAQGLQAELEAGRTQLETELAQLERTLAALAQEHAENDARARLVVRAPAGGVVTALTLSRGQSVQAGQTLFTLVPTGPPGQDGPEGPAVLPPLRAQLYAPSRLVGFVKPGQTVWLRYAAYPYQKFGMAEGRIVDASRTPILPQDLPAGQSQALLAAAQSQEPLYRVDVSLSQQHIRTYGELRPLKAGMALEADVVQDRRAVWEWVLEPVIAVSTPLLAAEEGR